MNGKDYRQMAGKKNNWKFLKNQKYSESVKGRDVYNDQQLRRGVLKESQTMFSRNIISLCISALAAFGIFFVECGCIGFRKVYIPCISLLWLISCLFINAAVCVPGYWIPGFCSPSAVYAKES